jgi:hypothetical protein
VERERAANEGGLLQWENLKKRMAQGSVPVTMTRKVVMGQEVAVSVPTQDNHH